MLDLPENELFSAYIDGELTADEQAEVERILNDNPEAQQLVDELRSLSNSLQSLPAYKLNEDLAARVLRQAEQEMLGQPSATPLPKFHHVEVPQARSTSWARRLLRPRNFAWSAVAIAVAIFLMLNDTGSSPDDVGNVAQGPMTIQPLDIEPMVEAVEAPAVPTVAEAPKPKLDESDSLAPPPDVPDAVQPEPAPTMVADTTPDAAPETTEKPTEPKTGTNPLLVLQCQLADGQVGHEALARLLEETGVVLDKPITEGSGPVEFILTSSQVQEVVSKLRSGSGNFTGVAYLPTADKAGPRIPSSFGPGQPKEMTAKEADAKTSGKATLHFKGTITVGPKAAASSPSAGTTSADGSSHKAKVTARAGQVKASARLTAKDPPIKNNETYRVRFLLKPSRKAAKEEAKTDE